MKSLLAIFRLTLRSILRERVAVSMLGLLLLVLALLPAGLQSDGTFEGALRMHIQYSLGFSFVLLAGMTLWVSCASVAGDLSSKRLQMVLTKPVGRAAVWWGKWLAVVTLITGLAFLCGAVTLFRVNRLVSGADLSPEARQRVFSQLITARRPVGPEAVDLTPQIDEMIRQQYESGAVPEGVPEEQVRPQIARFVEVSRFAASAGESVSWTFPFPRPLRAGESVQLAYRYDGSAMGVSQVPGTWVIEAADGLDRMEFPIEQSPSGEHVIPFTIPEGMDGVRTLTLTFQNHSEETGRVFFKTEQGLRFFLTGGAFTPNLIRAVLLLSGLLAILAAIGVSAGAAFSLPVACYAASVVLTVQAFSGVVEEVVEQGVQVAPDTPAIVEGYQEFRLVLFKGLLRVMRPLQVENPLTRVAQGVLIPNRELGQVLLLRFLPVILLAGGAGILIFSRREVGGAS